MDYTGDDLTADVELAWEVITKAFPKMASAYRTANIIVHRTYVGIDDMDLKFLSKWRPLRDELEYIFADCSHTLHDTAKALGEAMNEFAEKDGAAADALDKAQEGLPDSVPNLKPTAIPYSGRYYASDDYYDPKVPDYEYSGPGPTVDELKEKANATDDKIYEATCAELGGGWNPVTWLPRDWVEDSGDGSESTDYVMVIEKIEKIAQYNPSKFTTAIASLNSLGKEGKPFTTFNQEKDNALDGLSPTIWDGKAARDFRKNFLNAYQDIAATQLVYAGVLQGALEGYQASLEATYRDYMKIMDDTIAACEAVIESEGASSKSWETAGLSAAISIASGLVTGAATIALRFTLAGAAVSVGSAWLDVGGEKVEKIYKAIMDSFDTSKGNLDTFDEELETALKSDLEKVKAGRHDPDADLDFPRPGFVYGNEKF